MLFSVIIPAYNAGEVIHLPLSSLLAQTFKDFEVIIVDDCSPTDWYDKVEYYKQFMPITIIRREVNGGCGPTLQTGLDNAQGDYFIPIDSDDMFASSNTLFHFAQLVQNNNYPHAVSTSFAEYDPISCRTNIIDCNNASFVHGKAFNVEFCRENNITFPNQKWFEDGAFNFIAMNITNHIVRDNNVTYLWQKNVNSITRSRDYNVEVMPFYFAAYERAYPILKEKNPNNAELFILGALTHGYAYWNAFVKRNVDKKLTDGILNIIGNILEQSNMVETINNEPYVYETLCQSLSTVKRNVESQEGGFVELYSLNDWLKKFFGKSITKLEVDNNVFLEVAYA